MSQRTGLSVLISLFFFWGFVASANDVLIPIFKEKLHLEQWQSQLISFVFYVAYTSGTLLYLLVSKILKSDLLQTIGFRKGMALGLFLAASGTIFFIPASFQTSFGWMLCGLFIIGLGFSLMQTVANTLIICLDDPSRSSQRLSLAGGINNIGSTLGPLIIGYFLMETQHHKTLSTTDLYLPYLAMGICFSAMALWFLQSTVPDSLSNISASSATLSHTPELFKNKKVFYSMIAIFVYVGVEVSSVSNFPEWLRKEYIPDHRIVPAWISLYWAGLMMGRWADASRTLSEKKSIQTAAKIILPFAGFLFYMLVQFIGGNRFYGQWKFVFFIPLFVVTDFLSEGKPEKQLKYYSMMGIISLLCMMFSKSSLSVYGIILSGMYCSTLWPCIFSIALKGENKRAASVSVLLIMMIMGGGIISVLQGWLASENLLGIRYSYFVGVLCFLYLAWFGARYDENKKVSNFPFSKYI